MTDERFTKEEADAKIGRRIRLRTHCTYVDTGTCGKVIEAREMKSIVTGEQQYYVAVKFDGYKVPLYYPKEQFQKDFIETEEAA